MEADECNVMSQATKNMVEKFSKNGTHIFLQVKHSLQTDPLHLRYHELIKSGAENESKELR
jgi:hypothetical protein